MCLPISSDVNKRQECRDFAANVSPDIGPAGWCFPGSGYCLEDEHFIIWMRTAGLSTFRKLFAVIERDIEPGEYHVRISNGILDNRTGIYMKQDLSGPQIELYPVSSFGGTKSVVLSTIAPGLGGKNPFLGIAYIIVGVGCIILAIGFCIKDRISPRELGSAPFLFHDEGASGNRMRRSEQR
mmetsp:Transcript_5207/g.15933  ORF Transcript_5207/g.15933 Transcript_5207/m.15933 type:complete len:182 (+) Transcript_5207:226-771(+)